MLKIKHYYQNCTNDSPVGELKRKNKTSIEISTILSRLKNFQLHITIIIPLNKMNCFCNFSDKIPRLA